MRRPERQEQRASGGSEPWGETADLCLLGVNLKSARWPSVGEWRSQLGSFQTMEDSA